jgi:RNA polymerase sigma-70 factor (sigma-E family)
MTRAAPRESGAPPTVPLGEPETEGDVVRRTGTDAGTDSGTEPVGAQETDGFGDFVEVRWRSLVRFGYLLTGDWGAAEDLTQAALERTWSRWDQVRVERPESYVKAAMVNQMRSRWRRRSVEVADGRGFEGHRDQANSSDVSADHALREALWAELLHLPARMRAVIVLRVWEDLSEAETARLLGCSVGSVKSQMSRGMTRLRERPGVRDAAGRAAIGSADGEPEGEAR